MTDVTLSGLRKRFGKTEIIPSLDLSIEDGEFVVLVGPSGCGKSTLLRMIAGLESIDAGDLSIGGKRVNDLSPKQRNIAMVFQNYALYPHMKVRENMAFSLQLAKTDRATIAEQVRKASDILGLGPLLDRLPRQLSGGQRQRVAMGRAIVRNPSLFLFDEPLSNLDAKLRVQMRAEIRGLHDRLKATTVYVTHDQIEAMTMADKIVVLREGRIEQVGYPTDLYARPANLFVATFLGSPEMNLIPAQRSASGLDLGEDGRLTTAMRLDVDAPREITLGIRPHNITLGPAENSEITGTIVLMEHTGAENLITCNLPSGRKIRAIAPPQMVLRIGEQVGLVFDPLHSHYFDRNSGRRLAS